MFKSKKMNKSNKKKKFPILNAKLKTRNIVFIDEGSCDNVSSTTFFRKKIDYYKTPAIVVE
jgi:hypothetical protein